MENLFKKRQERLSIFNRSRNKVVHQVEPKEVPDDILKSCEVCNASLPYEDFVSNLYVCPRCGHHLKLSARERIRQLMDQDSFREMDALLTSDGSTFEGYADKLDKYKRATGLKEAVICGTGKIHGIKLVVAIMDSNFMMGSMGSVVGEKITRAIEHATKKKLPLLISCTSGGARMQEGIDSLMQMAKTSAAIERHNQAGLLYISLLTNPTTGGVSASFAMLGDMILAEPNALIGFAGRRVIEKTINEVLPKEFQRSEFLLEKGFVDAIVERKDLKDTLYKLLSFHVG
ncbi:MULTISPECIES: acetyl-CoA carboxylase, carboxyltransferase subunit beta [unclassified Breznakia]|uniref:acetyl-CoA carboxylase, carboxyltransferase subunit beta n=1 Tax=unclassified Breznakia TaxID=2623764 RepID=UPI002475F27B|nr:MULTISPECIES: acetyl-CoA carboxylase, carboxyltransferase subunit beta [unclassified Breznakia]MDH6365869.1 acetyl-CoA carboxylase carboxyl transferase subunit beta [Breznakia sp. PH1-1]MDH6403199.1 acetyl-CoA carboxylase carboxyl transferase subunit beta [Breznakia sp. PF1-11]MDH6410908.1 acetyl-CoA carboxylase carboxyl transferase subunit beta [Breznakia sp. PFB1-11]MDH6413035.1 acetyl-CoA carboxylase carboxyl transferase subunit beta [Breznakia sp. PFB1-14]MDH6415403.1 acetyl-CoA carboxy